MKIPLSRKTGPGVTGEAADRRPGPRFDSRSNRRMPPLLHIASTPDRFSPAAAGPGGQRGAGTPPRRSLAAWPPSSPLGMPSLRGKSASGSFVINIARHDNTRHRGPRSDWLAGLTEPPRAVPLHGGASGVERDELGQELPVGPQTRDTRDVAAGPWRGEARRCVVNAQMRGRGVSLRGDVGVG